MIAPRVLYLNNVARFAATTNSKVSNWHWTTGRVLSKARILSARELTCSDPVGEQLNVVLVASIRDVTTVEPIDWPQRERLSM